MKNFSIYEKFLNRDGSHVCFVYFNGEYFTLRCHYDIMNGDVENSPNFTLKVTEEFLNNIFLAVLCAFDPKITIDFKHFIDEEEDEII